MPNSMASLRIADLLDKIEHRSVDVGTYSTMIARGDQLKRFLFVQNDGNEDVYIMFGRPSAIHQGIRLSKNGGTAMFSLCNSSLCAMDLFAITKSMQPVRLLITEGY